VCNDILKALPPTFAGWGTLTEEQFLVLAF
jgi:hypothetical protein